VQKPIFFVSPSVKRLVANSGWNVLGIGAGRMLNLLAMVLVARELGLHDFGYFAFIQSTIGTLGIFAGASLGATAIRFVSLYLKTDPEKTGRVIGLVFVTSGILTATMAAIALASAGLMARSLTDTPSDTLVFSFSVAALTLVLMSLRGVQDALLSGFNSYREAAMLKLIEGAAVVLCVPTLAARFGLIGAVSGMAIALVVPLLFGLPRVRSRIRLYAIRVSWRGMRSELPILFGFSLPAFISSTISMPVTWLGLYLLSQQSDGIGQIALFNAAYQWYGPLIFLPMMINSAGIPVLVKLWASGRQKEFRRIMLLLLTAGAMIPGTAALAIFFMREAIMAAYGSDFLPGVAPLLILIAAAPLAAMARLCGTALESMNCAWLVLRGSAIWAAAFLSCAIYLVPANGAVGLAVGFCVGAVAQFLYMLIKVVELLKNSEKSM